jgi:Calcineurin-like phosphoesterase
VSAYIGPPPHPEMRVVCVSDTHNKLDRVRVPDGNLLVHAGDATLMGEKREVEKFLRDLKALPHKHKVVIAGNHDWNAFHHPERYREQLAEVGATYLQDELYSADGFLIYGSPWQPEFCGWAFNLPRGPRLREKWDRIPPALHMLVTHGPPVGIMDATPSGECVGDADLLDAIMERPPVYHVFGHIHHSYGRVTTHRPPTTFVNAATCNERYEPTNEPIVLDVPAEVDP